jgi:RimJ/RimL family protein N-acetyltransferase
VLADGAVGLREWRADDLPLVEEAAGDPGLLVGTTLPRPFTPGEGAAFIERQWSRQTTGEGWSLAITFEGKPVGCGTLMLRRPAIADLGYWLVERARGQGIGVRAVGLLVDWALRRPGIEAVEAFVAEDNAASRRLLERLGFTLTGSRRHRVNDVNAKLLVYRLAPERVDRRAP